MQTDGTDDRYTCRIWIQMQPERQIKSIDKDDRYTDGEHSYDVEGL